jgi:hypothetical protein
MRQFFFVLIVSLLFCIESFAQVYTNKPVGEKNKALIDSLKQQEYPYILPIWGEKAAKLGFELPYSAGLGVNYMWQESDLIIDNLSVGFNNGPMTNVDELIRFDNAVAGANIVGFRPDIWLFPFLNVYGIIAQAKTSTTIDAALWLPDIDNNWNEVTAFSTTAKFDVTSFGFGLTPTMGVGGGWLALDMNMVWSDVSALDKPVFTFVFGPRLGKTFKFKNPDMNLAFWVGGFRVKFTSETSGSIDLSEVLDVSETQEKVDEGFIRVEDASNQVNGWWNSLSPEDQLNPVNKGKYEGANRLLDKTGNLLTTLDGALSTASTSTVQYSLDKNLKDMWNFIVGAQFQLNKHWMIRAEYGFLGSRQQFLSGLQYRFGL